MNITWIVALIAITITDIYGVEHQHSGSSTKRLSHNLVFYGTERDCVLDNRTYLGTLTRHPLIAKIDIREVKCQRIQKFLGVS